MNEPIAISLCTPNGGQITVTMDEARAIWQELDKLFGPNRMKIELIPPSLPTYKFPPVTCGDVQKFNDEMAT